MKSKIPKVAILSSGFLPVPAVKGGAVESLCENFIAENEKRKRLAITVYSNYDKDAERESSQVKYAKFKYIRIPRAVRWMDILLYKTLKLIFRYKDASSFRYIFQRLYFILRVSYDLSKSEYDRLIFENQVIQLLCLKLFGNYKRYKSKYYFHIHNEISTAYGLKRYVVNGNNIAVSNYIAESLKGFLNDGKGSGNYSVLRNSVNEKNFTERISPKERAELRSSLGIESDEKVLLFAGRLSEEKGIDKLLLSLNKVQFENYKLLVVGSSFFGADIYSSFTEKLKEIANPVREKIVFTGYIDYDEMPKIYQISDIAVLPSVWNDPAPLTVIEAITSGLPVITTRSGGIPEYANSKCAIIHEINERLVDEIASSIDSLINDEYKLTQMSMESVLASKNLTLSNYYTDMIRLLNIKGVGHES